MNNEEHRRIVAAGIDKLKFAKKDKESFTDTLMAKAQASTKNVQTAITPILKAGGGFDKHALATTIGKFYTEEFAKYDKDELIVLCASLHIGIMMESIEQSPWGSDKPDLLS